LQNSWPRTRASQNDTRRIGALPHPRPRLLFDGQKRASATPTPSAVFSDCAASVKVLLARHAAGCAPPRRRRSRAAAFDSMRFRNGAIGGTEQPGIKPGAERRAIAHRL